MPESHVLEKLGTHDDIPLIKEMLDDDDDFVRRLAVSAFEELGTHDDIPLIKEMLVDNDSDVRSAAISVLKKLVTHDDLPMIKEMLQNDNYDVKGFAVWIFENLITHDDLPIIKDLLNYNEVKTTAFSIFEKFSNEKELKEITEKIALGKIINDEMSLNCLISLDEKFYSPKKEVLLLHKDPREIE
jgi:HEAT repeat protein